MGRVKEKEKQKEHEINNVLQKTKIESLRTELLERDIIITERTNEINLLRIETEENKEQIDALNQEIENKNNINESIIAENENMKVDMRKLKAENEELKRAKENNPNIDRIKKQLEEETKTKDEKLRRAENNKRALAINIAKLEEQINNLKSDTSAKYDRATTM